MAQSLKVTVVINKTGFVILIIVTLVFTKIVFNSDFVFKKSKTSEIIITIIIISSSSSSSSSSNSSTIRR
jgi:hypothetical protein